MDADSGAVLERLFVLADGFPVSLLRVVDSPEIVDGFRIRRIQFEGVFVALARGIQLHHLVVGDAELVGQDCARLGALGIHVRGFAVHLARHQNVPANLGAEVRLDRRERIVGPRLCRNTRRRRLADKLRTGRKRKAARGQTHRMETMMASRFLPNYIAEIRLRL